MTQTDPAIEATSDVAATDDHRDAATLEDAAAVIASRREINAALAALAIRPLDEAAAEQMRRALGSSAAQARTALSRLRLSTASPMTRTLRVIASNPGGPPATAQSAPSARRAARRPSSAPPPAANPSAESI